MHLIWKIGKLGKNAVKFLLNFYQRKMEILNISSVLWVTVSFLLNPFFPTFQGHIDTAWLWPYAETKRKCARR
jgi:alpha-mannosidase